MKTISVLALTAVAILDSCQQQPEPTTTQDVAPIPPTVDNTINK